MPGLAALLYNGIIGIIGWFAARMGKNAGVVVALMAAFAALWSALLLAINGALYGLAVAVPAPAALVLSMLPSNLGAGVAAILTMRVARFIYDYHREVVKLDAQAAWMA